MVVKTRRSTLLRSFIESLPYALVIPSILVILYLLDLIVAHTLKVLLVIYFLIFVVGPLIFKYSYSLQRSVCFLNFVNIPPNANYSNPPKYGIDGVRNFYLTTEDGVRLGIWQVLPERLLNDTSATKDENYYKSALKNGQDVIIYNHGNSGNRVASHRVELYKVLRKYFHVIAYDYRSYGDSSKIEPTEVGVVSDSKFMYKWVRNSTSSNIFVWGHSLGTAISTHTIALLNSENIIPTGLVLESPFNNMRDEISEHPFAKLFRHLPWFSYTVIEPMQENNFTFESDKYIVKVDCPVLILHAKDDIVVPYRLGKKLYLSAKEHRLEYQGNVLFHSFERKEGYGHKFICRSPQLGTVIEQFVAHCVDRKENQ